MSDLNNIVLGTQPEPPAQPEPSAQLEPPAQPEPPAQLEPPAQPEPLTNPYAQIIAQKDEQISALLQQTQALNEQIISMVNSGAQFSASAKSAQPTHSTQHTVSLSDDDDYSLSALANEIGKRRAH